MAEWLMLPEVAVTTSVVVPVGVPGFAALLLPPPPQPLSESSEAATKIRPAAPTRVKARARRRPNWQFSALAKANLRRASEAMSRRPMARYPHGAWPLVGSVIMGW